VRKNESVTALGLLGVPRENLRFLDLPEADLRSHTQELARLLREHLSVLRPDHVLVPFRYDRHPDHLAVNRVATAECSQRSPCGRLRGGAEACRTGLLPQPDDPLLPLADASHIDAGAPG
jgi:LmbE family N-acetylglucosaminyl deacetylase